MTFEELDKKFEPYTVEQLEEVILAHWKTTGKADEMLEDYMYIRKEKINRVFEWTPEHKEKLLAVNQKIISCFEELRDETQHVIQTLRKRIEKKDKFLHDFDIEARIIPFIMIPNENGILEWAENGMEEILDAILPEFAVMNVSPNKESDWNDILYLDREQNWNIDPHFKGQFDKHFISQGIHDLYDHTAWSFADILRINHLWVDMKINHQHDAYV